MIMGLELRDKNSVVVVLFCMITNAHDAPTENIKLARMSSPPSVDVLLDNLSRVAYIRIKVFPCENT